MNSNRIRSFKLRDEYSIIADVDFWTGLYFEKSNMKDTSCTVSGESCYGLYSKSITDKMNSYTTDIYIDGNNIEYGLRSDTGEMVFINLMNAEFFDTQPYLSDINNPEESAVLLAIETEVRTGIRTLTVVVKA